MTRGGAMNALLIYPDVPDTFWSFKYALRFVSRKSTAPPLGLLTVAAMLPKEWSLRVVDLKTRRLRKRDLEWAEMVYISAMQVQRDSVLEIIKECKKYSLPIVAGGPLFTAYHHEFTDIDHFVLNDAEETLPLFLEDLARGEAKPLYTTDAFPPMKLTPVPRWELVRLSSYAEISIQYSRGCPYDCDFCDIGVLFGRKIRTKSPHQILLELDKLYSLKWRGEVFFVDDNFIGNKTKLKRDLLPALLKWQQEHGRPFTFSTEASIDLAQDDELMQSMVDVGFTSVFVGVETTNESALAECNKIHNTLHDPLESIRKIHKRGMMVKGGFIVGFDSDDTTIFEKISEFIQSSEIVTAMVGLLNAPAGTQLYKRLLGEDRILHNSTGDNTDATLNFIPRMDPKILVEGYREIIKNIYTPKQYYERVRAFLREFPTHKLRGRLAPRDISAFFKSLFRLGIVGKERVQYWRLLFWTLFHRPRHTALAVTLAIYGFHFRRVFDV